MKVSIGPYPDNLISIGRLEHSYSLWRHNEYYLDEDKFDLLDKIVFGFLDKLEWVLKPINLWWHARPRKIKVRVDNYDVWNADATLALVIYPVLVKLKERKQGSPIVDDIDVPANMWDSETEDTQIEERWNWVLNEMIWAFEQYTKDDRGEDMFDHNVSQLDMAFVDTEVEGKVRKMVEMTYQKDPNLPAYWVDEIGKQAHRDKVANGFRLFAKYYFALWN
jgi:hypothetical protein